MIQLELFYDWLFSMASLNCLSEYLLKLSIISIVEPEGTQIMQNTLFSIPFKILLNKVNML